MDGCEHDPEMFEYDGECMKCSITQLRAKLKDAKETAAHVNKERIKDEAQIAALTEAQLIDTNALKMRIEEHLSLGRGEPFSRDTLKGSQLYDAYKLLEPFIIPQESDR